MDKIGPMCHGADDCGLVLEAIAGPDPRDESTLDEAFRYAISAPPKGKWKICLLKDMEESNQPHPAENYRRALEVLAPVAEFEERELPQEPYHQTVMTVRFSEAGAAFAHLCKDDLAERLVAPESRAVPHALQTIPATAYLNALRMRTRLNRVLTRWMAPYDAVITPTQKLVAPPLGTTFGAYFGSNRRLAITSLGNLLGWPCITVPSGFGERGLPTAIQIVGAPRGENRLLSMAACYQEHTDWHLQHPPDP